MSESKRALEKSPPPTDPNASDCASPAPLYTADHWENDPFLTRNPERARLVEAHRFEGFRRLNFSPDQIVNEDVRLAYENFLANFS
jgi:hypothetical protein